MSIELYYVAGWPLIPELIQSTQILPLNEALPEWHTHRTSTQRSVFI